MDDLPRSSAGLGRAAALAGPGATVRNVRALAGGTHARTCLVQTAGPEREFVLRGFDPGDDAARREMRILSALDGLGGPAPPRGISQRAEPSGRIFRGPERPRG